VSKIRVGLVGAGPWAKLFHGPMIAGGAETELVSVWARRPEAAQEVAAANGSNVAPSFEALLAESDAVVFAVPPNVQAELVPAAAKAGKALLLEKPLGFNLAQAQQVADAVQSAGVVNQVMFTNRYVDHIRAFLAELEGKKPIGAVASFINGACLPGGTFATPWRIELGAILDLGPHVLDLLDVALGPIVDISAVGDPRRWVAVTSRHESGAVSQAALSLNTPDVGDVTGVRVFTEEGDVSTEFVAADPGPTTPGNILSDFVAAIKSGKPHELDVNRALYLQKLMDQAANSLNN
jgi:predicted dehydrogenase